MDNPTNLSSSPPSRTKKPLFSRGFFASDVVDFYRTWPLRARVFCVTPAASASRNSRIWPDADGVVVSTAALPAADDELLHRDLPLPGREDNLRLVCEADERMRNVSRRLSGVRTHRQRAVACAAETRGNL